MCGKGQEGNAIIAPDSVRCNACKLKRTAPEGITAHLQQHLHHLWVAVEGGNMQRRPVQVVLRLRVNVCTYLAKHLDHLARA